MRPEDNPPNAPPQGDAGRILAFPVQPGMDERSRKLRLIARTYALAVESVELQLRLEAAGQDSAAVAAERIELVGRAEQMLR